ncbi:MerR family transcriptional regulator [Fructilactobacillus sp. Tb1]|uniref:MerR family transcriptional regulator n=1 Tax=Fructilactobacillus sp. Tb1 TaxID=3422304 RepID=UPI003D26962E
MKISEVAAKFNVTPVALRYYEKMGLIPPVKRTGGKRDYQQVDLNWIEFITCMRKVKLPVKDLVEYTKLFPQGIKSKQQRRQILVNELTKLQNQDKEIQNTIKRLEHKIKLYDENKIN